MINGRMRLLQQLAINVVSGPATMQGFEGVRVSNREKSMPLCSSYTSERPKGVCAVLQKAGRQGVREAHTGQIAPSTLP